MLSRILTIVVICTNLQAQDLKTILDKYYKNSGGVERWGNVNSIIYHGVTKSLDDMITGIGDQEVHSEIKINKKMSNSLILERWLTIGKENPKDTFSTCYNGENYWRHFSGQAPESFLSFASRYGGFVRMSEPLLLLSADSIELLGTSTIPVNGEDRESFTLRVTLKNGGTLKYYIDIKSYLLNASSQDSENAVLSVTSDYRELDGLLFPFKRISWRRGKVFSEESIFRIIINRDIPTTFFEFPESQFILNKPFNLN